jgi:hypothetical protein
LQKLKTIEKNNFGMNNKKVNIKMSERWILNFFSCFGINRFHSSICTYIDLFLCLMKRSFSFLQLIKLINI